MSTKADKESATTEEDPEIIALVQEPEPRSLHLHPQAQSNDQVLQEVKIARQQNTTISWQFQGKRDKLVQKERVPYYRQTNSSPLQTVVPYSLQRTVLEQKHDKRGTSRCPQDFGKAEGMVLLARAQGSGGEMGQGV